MSSPNEPIATTYARAPTKSVTAGGVTFAYRELGPVESIPVVFFTHLAASLDNWDPRLIDAIASGRHVITFDQRGVGASTGKVPRSLEEVADDAYAFIRALGYHTVDVFAVSMGGMVAQDLVLAHPMLVRRLILAGTGPRGGKGIDKVIGVTFWDLFRAMATRSDVKEFLFFNRDAVGKAAAKAFVQRLDERIINRDKAIRLRAFLTQLKAIARYGRSRPADLSAVSQPTLIATGDTDRMVDSALSRDLHERITGSRLIVYPNSGHGAIFQFWEHFAPVAQDFLAP